MTRNIMTMRIRNSTTIVQICPMSFVFSSFPSFACTKLSFLVVLSRSSSSYSMRWPCLSSSRLISLPCSLSRLAISLISSRCCSCSSCCCFWKAFIRIMIIRMDAAVFERSLPSDSDEALGHQQEHDDADPLRHPPSHPSPYTLLVLLLLNRLCAVYVQ